MEQRIETIEQKLDKLWEKFDDFATYMKERDDLQTERTAAYISQYAETTRQSIQHHQNEVDKHIENQNKRIALLESRLWKKWPVVTLAVCSMLNMVVISLIAIFLVYKYTV